MLKKYSKSSTFYASGKSNYFDENESLLREEIARNEIYRTQPIRLCCKICQHRLDTEADFSSHGVSYKFCAACGHLNGGHEETDAFIHAIYVADSGGDYSKDYLDMNFLERTRSIYVPKVDFLVEAIGHAEFNLLDVGCGSGYFVHACTLHGISAKGIDVSQDMVEFGNNQLVFLGGKQQLQHVGISDFFEQVRTTDSLVVSAIGVIEHLKDPHDLLKAFRQSNARYLYYSVPMFSTSVALENVFENVYPRQLSGGHTHLFTESSIEKIHSLFALKPVAQWRFGTDMMDLFRSLLVTLKDKGASNNLLSRVTQGLGPCINGMQGVLDQNDFCSEIHCLVEKEEPQDDH